LAVIDHDRASPSGSLAVGVNAYGTPTVAPDAGVPEIVGARFWPALTVMEKGANAALNEPSVTWITMFDTVPRLAVVGVPEILPVEAVNFTHDGLLVMV
jgi:hypothetical protein